MRIAIIGSGGREDALCRKLKSSTKTNNIFCIPGNAGTSEIATNLDINFLNFKLLLKTLKYHQIELVIVGLVIWRYLEDSLTFDSVLTYTLLYVICMFGWFYFREK